MFGVVFIASCSSTARNHSSENSGGSAGAGGAAGSGGVTSTGGAGGMTTGGMGGTTSGGMGGTTSGGMGGVGAVAGTGGVAACAGSTKQVTAQLLGDTTIYPENTVASPNCEATITSGVSEVLSVGAVADKASRTLLRFKIDAETAQAFQTGKVQSAQLVVHRALGGACSGACPVQAGGVLIYPLTTDWVEGTSGSTSGATWCYGERGGKLMKWQQNGATGADDRGNLAGTLQFNGTDENPTVALDPSPLKSWIDPKSTISLLLERQPAENTKLFIYAKDNSLAQGASLTFQVCQ